jgi:hypothetical protein
MIPHFEKGRAPSARPASIGADPFREHRYDYPTSGSGDYPA